MKLFHNLLVTIGNALLLFCCGVSLAFAQVGGDDFDSTVQALRTLYQTEQFEALEKALDQLAHSKDQFISGKTKASAAYWAFRRQMPGPGTQPNEIERIKRWREKIPGSPYSVLAESRYWYGMAWNARGTGYANSVDETAWAVFRESLQRAEAVLLEGPTALQDSPIWYQLLLTIAQDSHDLRSNPDQVLEAAIRKWPRYFDFYELRLTRLLPRWGGSWEDVDKFITRAATPLAKSEGDSLYARLYVSLQAQGIPTKETTARWGRLKPSFRDLVTRYPDPIFKNLYASYACLVKDKKELSAALQKIGPNELIPSVWLRDAPYENCQMLK